MPRSMPSTHLCSFSLRSLSTILIIAGFAPVAGADIPYRLTSIDHDYDNNGITDATTTIFYNGAGEPTLSEYRYVGDGTPDLFVTEDDGASEDDTVFAFDVDGFTTDVTLDRVNFDATTEAFDVAQTFTAGVLTRTDSTSDTGGPVVGASYATFAYVAGDLDQVTERSSADDSILYTLDYQYGGDGLPSIVTFNVPPVPPFFPGIDLLTTYTWRPDGQVDSVSSVGSSGPNPFTDGSGDYIYDAEGRRTAEVFVATVGSGAVPAEFPDTSYRKTLDYDVLGLLSREEFDVDDDGSIEATRIPTWEPGECTTVFVWASNGRPEFEAIPGTPYVPGTGWQSLRNCPEPAQALSLLMGSVAIAGFGRRRRGQPRTIDA